MLKHKALLAGVCVSAIISLSGCSLFYPNSVPTPTHTLVPTKTPTPTPTPTKTPNLAKVDLNIIDSSAFQANGYVEVVAEALKVLEDDGKCTVKFTQGSASQSITVGAVQNVTSTVCSSMQIPLSSFKSTGDISFVVTYQSSKSFGKSSVGTIQIQ